MYSVKRSKCNLIDRERLKEINPIEAYNKCGPSYFRRLLFFLVNNKLK